MRNKKLSGGVEAAIVFCVNKHPRALSDLGATNPQLETKVLYVQYVSVFLYESTLPP